MRGILWLCFFIFTPITFANQNVLLEQIGRLEHQETKSDFFKSHQLVFFFASTCPHCHKAAPSLKAWAKLHQAVVMAVSFDRESLPEFPHTTEASESLIQAAYAGQPITFPALFVINTKTNQLYPAMMGEWTKVELEHRLKALIAKIERYEGEHG